MYASTTSVTSRGANACRSRTPSTGTFTALNLEQGSPGQAARERSTSVDEANARDTEMRQIVPIQRTNEAYERVLRSDVRYRFVIDIASLRG